MCLCRADKSSLDDELLMEYHYMQEVTQLISVDYAMLCVLTMQFVAQHHGWVLILCSTA